MKLPNGDRAVVPDDKLFGYLLNEQHETQSGHAELFRRLFGIGAENGETLRAALLHAAANRDATAGRPSPHGEKYEIRFEMPGLSKVRTILGVRMIEHGKVDPRLVTAFVE